jgi:hypothetical protein
MIGEAGAPGAPQTVISAVAVFVVSPPDATVNVKAIVDGPGAADEDASNVKSTGAKSGAAIMPKDGAAVMPGGRPDGSTAMSAVGAQSPGTSEARIVAAAPPAFRRTADGAAAGVKSGRPTFTEKVAEVLIPRESLTSAVTTRGPGAASGEADTVKVTSRDGGIDGTGIVEGETLSPAERSGKVTVGVPAYPSSEETVREFG